MFKLKFQLETCEEISGCFTTGLCESIYENRLFSGITDGSTDVTRLQSFRLLQDDVSVMIGQTTSNL